MAADHMITNGRDARSVVADGIDGNRRSHPKSRPVPTRPDPSRPGLPVGRDVVKNPQGADQWCGTRLDEQPATTSPATTSPGSG
jgi:hypothetical protein